MAERSRNASCPGPRRGARWGCLLAALFLLVLAAREAQADEPPAAGEGAQPPTNAAPQGGGTPTPSVPRAVVPPGGGPIDLPNVTVSGRGQGMPGAGQAPTAGSRGVVQSPTLTPEPVSETTASVNLVTRQTIDRELPRSMSDAIRYQPGLWSAQSSNGQMGTPSIRGFMGNEVLLTLDGLRLNNSFTPTGPGYDADLIDMDMIDHVEVLRTPDSVLYGTDALGGVVALYTGWPVEYTRWGTHVGGHAGFTGTTGGQNQRRYRVQAYVATPRLRVATGVSIVDADDLRAGGSAGRQHPTAYQSQALDVKMETLLSRRDTLAVSFFGMEKQFDGHFLFPNRVQSTNQKRHAGLVRWTHRGWTRVADDFEILLGLVYSYRLVARTDVLNRDAFEIFTPQIRAVAHKRLPFRHALTYGFDARGEDLSAAVTKATGTISSVPDAKTGQLGAFLQDEWDASRRVRITAGGRVDAIRVKTDPNPARTDPLVDPNAIRIDRSDVAVTGKLGVLYRASRKVSLTANVARGYRFPNAQDLSAFRQAPDEIVVGNPNLDAETSTTVEVGAHVTTRRVRANAVVYHTWYDKLIIGRPGVFNGQTYADRNGNGMEDSDEGFLLRQNAGSARDYGLEADAEVDVTRSWTIFGNLSFWHGHFEPMPTEPLGLPTNASLGVRFEPSKRFWGEVVGHWVKDFDYIDPTFYNAEAFFRKYPQDPASPTLTNDHTVPGFTTLDVRVGVKPWRHVEITAGVENVFDQNYRWYGDRHDAPGRTFLINVTLDR